ncbi:MAG: hypothetical protein H6577_10700 [Lewinellaceae bacterium]|nr:hypothetical protein [Saprospiraceae bacterium]MCB9338582.1 hypothetical protein [Lewinellaceae bacterium]
MNQKVAIFLTTLFISAGCRDVFTILYFYGNQSFIAENLCINKDQPEKNCHGKCYLSKQLEENDGKQSNDPPPNRLFGDFELKALPTEVTIHGLLIQKLEGRPAWAFEKQLYQSVHSSSLFQPPEILS